MTIAVKLTSSHLFMMKIVMLEMLQVIWQNKSHN